MDIYGLTYSLYHPRGELMYEVPYPDVYHVSVCVAEVSLERACGHARALSIVYWCM